MLAKIRLITFTAIGISLCSTAQYSFDLNTIHNIHLINDIGGKEEFNSYSMANKLFDVTYYRLDLKIFTNPNYLKGHVTISGINLSDSTNNLSFDLMRNMQIDSILINGLPQQFIQNDSWFNIHLKSTLKKNENLTVDIFYQGLPVSTGFGSFIFTSHNGVPWIYSLSEPFGAKDWWPCKDDPSDKADSADIIVTCDSILRVGSQGLLISIINNEDGTRTYHWKTQYPIASYLISVAITNYVQFSNWFKYSEIDSMEILNYVLPEHYESAITNLPIVVDMLSIYSRLFGIYPFAKEKYGHAEISGYAAMEHQTMTSLFHLSESIVAHELAHQWFGDMITCRTWADLWLNEGFAQYSTALYYEQKYGKERYLNYMRTQLDKAMNATGVIGIPDFSSERALFDENRIYAKGACVLHMLRHVLGDSIFFKTIYTYANHPNFKYKTATISDFQTICEQVSGKDLSYFFQEWIYGERYPNYLYSWYWDSDNHILIINIKQTNNAQYPVFFTMPLDIKVTSNNTDTIITVWNNAKAQTFAIHINEKVDAVLLDPEDWVLKYAYSVNTFPPISYQLDQNYPNPFNSTTIISYGLPGKAKVSLKIYDILGREIETLASGVQLPGYHTCEWNAKHVTSGIYFYSLTAGSTKLVRKMVVIKLPR